MEPAVRVVPPLYVFLALRPTVPALVLVRAYCPVVTASMFKVEPAPMFKLPLLFNSTVDGVSALMELSGENVMFELPVR